MTKLFGHVARYYNLLQTKVNFLLAVAKLYIQAARSCHVVWPSRHDVYQSTADRGEQLIG